MEYPANVGPQVPGGIPHTGSHQLWTEHGFHLEVDWRAIFEYNLFSVYRVLVECSHLSKQTKQNAAVGTKPCILISVIFQFLTLFQNAVALYIVCKFMTNEPKEMTQN